MSATAPLAALQTAPALEAQRLNTYYGLSHILRNIDFRVMPQETVTLLGRNGMGKTTLLRTLMGLVRPKSGRISVGTRDITGWRPSAVARAGLAFVPEDRGVFPNLTVKENPPSPHGPAAAGAPTGLWTASIRCFPGSLSGVNTGAISCPAASRKCWRSAAH